ncbi:uncharacterized protein LOC107369503 [Tetranychus urticae]|uniref:uncharacterized protein LOC107369503 n=1 Tax=Tetranychus urticae TaxID=32264 RepID=UPI00077BE63D|nr:uncharacterized protein LOC107369503 [Tetranychus urticae]
MSDQEVKGKKNGRGRGRGKASTTSTTTTATKTTGSNSNATAAASTGKKSKKKGSSIKGIRTGRGRGRNRIEDSSSDEETVVVPKIEPTNGENETPVETAQEIPIEMPKEKVSDENFINRILKDDKPLFTESNHLPLIHTFQSPSLNFKDEIDDDLTLTLSFVGPRINVPLHNNKPLTWNHKVNLIGDKCPSPRIHICEKCERPILLYGRLIPCKHVFCYDCAKANNPLCLRCNDKVIRVEKNKLGAVFMCIYENCRRTYLSHRDLQAHISHRHLRRSSSNFNSSNQLSKQSQQGIPMGASCSSSSLTVTSPTTLVGSSSLKNPFPVRSKTVHNSSSLNNFTHISSSRANSSSIQLSSLDDQLGSNNHQTHHSSHSSRNKLLSNKNFVISGKSPNCNPQNLNNLPRNSLPWPTPSQPSSTTSSASSSSFTSPTLPSSLPITNSWNLPLLSDPRQGSAISRHFYP